MAFRKTWPFLTLLPRCPSSKRAKKVKRVKKLW
jgi:hypothetical protein